MAKINAILKLKDQFSSPMKNAAKSCEFYNRKAKTTNKDTQRLAKQLKGNFAHSAKVAATALAAVGTVAVATGAKFVKNAAEQADTVDKMSQKIGISTRAYQEWDYAMGQSGVNISVMKTGMKTLIKQMQSASEGATSSRDAFNELGISIYDSNGQLKNQETIMKEAIGRLSGMENSSKRAALASTLFGKAGTELAPLLNSGAKGIKELIDRSHELGLVMDDKTIKAGVKLGDTFDDVKQSMSKVCISIGAQLMPYVQRATDYLLKHLPEIRAASKQVGKAFTKVGSGIKWIYNHANILIPVLAGVVSGLAAFKIISGVTAMMTVMSTVMTILTGEQVALNASLFACPLTWVVLGIAAVVVAGIALWKNWDTVCKWAGKLKKKFDKLLAPIKRVANWLGKVFRFSDKSVDVNINKTATTKTAPAPKHALGTTYFSGGRTGFSEGGRAEEAIFPSGTKIIPADKVKNRDGGSVNVYVTVQGNMVGDEETMKKYAKYTGEIIMRAL